MLYKYNAFVNHLCKLGDMRSLMVKLNFQPSLKNTDPLKFFHVRIIELEIVLLQFWASGYIFKVGSSEILSLRRECVYVGTAQEPQEDMGLEK